MRIYLNEQGQGITGQDFIFLVFPLVRGMASSRVPFYSPAKPGGGGIPNLLGFILDWYWTQKKLFPYLGPWGKN